jgi:hypothetical protein
MHFISVLENVKMYIKTYIKIAPTFFYCCTLHFGNTEILITNKCTFY